MTSGSVAVVGAGLAGLACARVLADAGAKVTVFDKSRGLGGRIATRRGPQGGIDHGAVAVSSEAGACKHTPHTQRFAEYLQAATVQGAAAIWPEAQGWVGMPGMSGIVKPLANGITVQVGSEVTALTRLGGGWQVGTAGGEIGLFDQIVLAVPQPQALHLLSSQPDMRQRIAGARMRAVWTAMVGFDRALPLTGAVIRRTAGPVWQAVRNAAKPGRAGQGEVWVLHGSADWTAAHLEHDKPEAAALLLAAFLDGFGLDPVDPVWLEGHRWRYGLTEQALGAPFVHDATTGLSVCGDWCLGDSACDAFVSGSSLGARLTGQ